MEGNRFLVVGLGNPGSQYENTRHNIGFLVIDELCRRWNCSAFQKKFKGLLTEASIEDRKVVLLKPQTFMNLSGESAREAVHFYKIPVESHLVVISDDLDLPPGNLRIRSSGGTGGHNGLKSVSENLGGDGYSRVRIGIGRSVTVPTESYVLSQIPKGEKELYEKAVQLAADAIETFVKDGIQKTMNTFNKRKTDES